MRKSPFCGKCGTEKVPLSSGELVCRPCANARNQAYKQRHAARVSAARADYRERNRATLRIKNREYHANNKDKDAAYYQANADRIKARVRAHREENKEELSAYFRRRWREDPTYREACRARLRAWKKLHPDRVNADWNRRRAQMMQAYPAWANDELIAEAYELARLRTIMTGIPWQVDHIVPLNSDLVCGLHCEANLQVIPKAANLAKSNDWWPDMPDALATSLRFSEAPSLYLVSPRFANTVAARNI
ncbi:hypothetical protein [Burkholderia ubonensis]|nr:hypothetical protein [Burkholderia ubonensis]